MKKTKRITLEASTREASKARFLAAARGEYQGEFVTVHDNAGITAEERQRRQEAVDGALANVGLEGFVPDAATQERARRWVNGEISMAELVALPEPTAKP